MTGNPPSRGDQLIKVDVVHEGDAPTDGWHPDRGIHEEEETKGGPKGCGPP